MKKFNALALCAVMAPVYVLGIGNVAAAEHDETATAQQETTDSVAAERNPGRDDASSTTTGEARDGSDKADGSSDQTRNLGEADTTRQKPGESVAVERSSSGDETASATTAEGRDGNGAGDEPNNQTQDLGDADTTQQNASESMAGEGSPDRDDASSAETAEARDQGDVANVPSDQAQEPSRSETPDTAEVVQPAFHADDLIGQEVKSRNDDATFGTISDLVFGEDGQLLSVVVEVGGFLGIGEEQVTISWSELERQLDADGESYVLYRQPR